MSKNKFMQILPVFLIMLLVSACAKKSGESRSNNDIESDSISTADQLKEYSSDKTTPAIVVEYDNQTLYFDATDFKRISSDIKQELSQKGILIKTSDGQRFILSASDVYLKGDRRGSGMGGNFIHGRDDFEQLPTKKEAEAIRDYFDEIQTLLEIGDMSPLKGVYWTKDIVHDSNENVLNYSSYWIYGKNNDSPYVSTQQTVNNGHLRLVKRISSEPSSEYTKDTDGDENKMGDAAYVADVFEGHIGEYPIRMNLYFDSEGSSQDNISYHIPISGNYTYTKSGTTLILRGEETSYGITLVETVKKNGQETGEFSLQRSEAGEELHGTFTNLTNGKTFKVHLQIVSGNG